MQHPLYKHDYSVGTKWHRLTILSRHGMYADCRCECGVKVTVQARALGAGNTKSCGCLRKGRTNGNYRHGDRVGGGRSRLHTIWTGMRTRCKRNIEYYEHVNVCRQWQDYPTFKRWALAAGYEDGLQIDRIKNHLGYNPTNCRWVTPKKQSQNRRKKFRNNTSGYTGVYLTSHRKPWSAMVFVDSHRMHVGYFKTALAAHRARLKFIRNL